MKLIKKSDLILILSIVIVGLLAFLLIVLVKDTGEEVRINVDGELYGVYALDVDRQIVIEKDGHKNIVEISDKSVFMAYSDCETQQCVHTGKISQGAVPIICARNKVYVIIASKSDTTAY